MLRGEAPFVHDGGTSCHVPQVLTGRVEDRPDHSFQPVWPTRDFLLHDVGPGPAENLRAGSATGAEWRSALLRGPDPTEQVSGPRQCRHDGRARSIVDAILWHGGEGRMSRCLRQPVRPDRAALPTFPEAP